jgi:(2Fe-2S) ferredoxin
MSDINFPLSRETLHQVSPVTAARLNRHVFVCTGKSCSANNSEATLEALREALKAHGLLYGKKGSLSGSVVLTSCGSVGLCAVGPAVLVYPDGVWYYNVQPEDADALVTEHLLNGRPVERLLALRLPPPEL